MGLVAGLREQYLIKSNRESGKGRYDVLLMPKDTSKLGVVLEFKTASDYESLETMAQDALTQITQKDYVNELRAAGIEKTLCVGLAFFGQHVCVDSTFA